MLKYFRCPDGEKIEVGECLKECRMKERCVTKATLAAIATGEFKWIGVPHVTQLLNGLYMEWLKAREGYTVSPRDRAFMLLGSTHHKLLEEAALSDAEIATELTVQGDGYIGTIDSIEKDDGGWVLTDYKTWGSYRVARALGLEKVRDSQGVKFIRRPELADLRDVELQLNAYRIVLEMVGFDIVSMKVQVTVRDGGLQAAKSRGIDELIYVIPVKRLPDEDVKAWFSDRSRRLSEAIQSGEPPEICSDEENWYRRRCRDYCDVAEFCPVGQLAKLDDSLVGDHITTSEVFRMAQMKVGGKK